MPLLAFDHVNIRTVNLPGMVAWYEDVLGLRKGARPDFPVPGAWLYLGDSCVLHLIQADPPPAAHTEGESLRLEHFAFRARDRAAFLAHLDSRGVVYRTFEFDAHDSILVFLRDPDGNRLHVDFAMQEA